jgi:hypothetical protein
MVYIINNYDGSQLVGITDKTVNNTATSLRLPGRDYKPYGEVIVENLVWMLQHFSGMSPPIRAVEGQIWYDSGQKVVKVFDRSQWLTVGKAGVGDQLPTSGQDGQLFYHATKKQLFVWDLSNWRLLAPVGASDGSDQAPTDQVTHTQWEAINVTDTGSTSHYILKLSVGGTCVAIFSEDATFSISGGTVPGYDLSMISPGINLNTNMSLNGMATQADVANNSLNLDGEPATSYMRRDQTNVPAVSGISLGSPSSPYLSMHADSFVGNATSATTATDATQLDGEAASYYLDATNINAGTLDVARLPFTPVNVSGDTMTGALTLNADPVAPLQPATKQYVDAIAGTIPTSLTITSGEINPTTWQNSTAGPDFTTNYVDLPPPLGKTVANLVAFIPSIRAIYFSGDVNVDDSLHCRWQIEGANIRVWVFNTEMRGAPSTPPGPSANYLAVWN